MKYNRLITDERLKWIDYPVGSCITTIIPVARNMAKILSETYPGSKMRLVCSGSSGAIISTIIATSGLVDVVQITHIKKDGETYCLSGHNTFKDNPYDNIINIIVDDQISTGTTMKRIWEKFTMTNTEEIISCIIVCMPVPIKVCNMINVDTLICYIPT